MRQAVGRAYDYMMVHEAKQLRYAMCGAEARIEQHADDPSRYRVRCFRCNDRWCPSCQRRRRRCVLARVIPRLPERDLRMVTLTMKSKDEPLRDQIDSLVESFRRLRRSKVWKDSQKGGYSFLEITYNDLTEQWHPHLHILVEGVFVYKSELISGWRIASRGSYVVDIKYINDPKKVGRYVTKYMTKPIPAKLYHCPPRLREAIDALKGVRMAQPFGTWHKIDRKEEDYDPSQWIDVGSYSDLRTRALAGDVEADLILRSIRGLTYSPETDVSELFDEIETGVLPGYY